MTGRSLALKPPRLSKPWRLAGHYQISDSFGVDQTFQKSQKGLKSSENDITNVTTEEYQLIGFNHQL